MALDHASVAQRVQVGYETTEGTAVAATKTWTALSTRMGIEYTSNPFRPNGKLYPTLVVPGKEWSQGAVEGVLDFNHIVDLLCAGVKNVTPTADGTSGQLWTVKPDVSGGDAIKTLTVEQGDSVRGRQFAGVFANALEFSVNRDETSVSSALMGRRMVEDNALTSAGSAPDIDAAPIAPGLFDIYIADSFANLATADPLERAFQIDVALTDFFSVNWPIRSANTSYGGRVRKPITSGFTLMTAAGEEAMDLLLPAMRGGTKLWLRLIATGAVIAGVTPSAYEFQFDCAFILNDNGGFDDRDDSLVTEWEAQIVADGTWGGAWQILTTNERNAL